MLKPWREVAEPHQDVLQGVFQQAEFAADLSRVHSGNAFKEYQDAALFFERTFITEGMKRLLMSLVKRLTGKGGDPVIQLQTAFGGGKTHTMLAVYHLAKGERVAGELQGVPSLLDEAGVDVELPRARVVVIDGNQLPPNQARAYGKGKDKVEVRTMWGELAWQLGGKEAYETLKESDEGGTSPGKGILAKLLSTYAPCVVLMDELVAYVRQFESDRSYVGGTYDSNLSFIQALTEAMKEVPTAILFASLPESEKEAGSQRGINALRALEHYFARVQAIWRPVATEEAFEIVRRRLFTRVKDAEAAELVCKTFAEMYQKDSHSFPSETQESHYLERLRSAYPIHPEIFDRLYEDWATLDNFQRTRGVLKLMAQVIYRLWADGNTDALIMPGSLPLYDTQTRSEVVTYLSQGWDPVIEREIDGPRSEPAEIEKKDTRFGSVQACKRVGRTIFLGSAPSTGSKSVRGVELERVLLGSVQPGQAVGTFKDALGRLSDRLHYLNNADSRFWFDVRPNLRREMEDRKKNIQDPAVTTSIQRQLETVKRGVFGAVHIFVPSNDIPDDKVLRLVVMSPETGYSKREERLWRPRLEAILQHKGDQPRHHQNRLIFLVADYDVLGRLRDLTCSMLSWKSILEDSDGGKLNLDQFQLKQAKKSLTDAKATFERTVTEAYRWVIAPQQTAKPGRSPSEIAWERRQLSTGASSIHQEIERVLKENEIVVLKWATVHVSKMLKDWFWKDDVIEVKVSHVWATMCRYLYFPRLQDENTLQSAISEGTSSREFFGIAGDKDENTGRYIGFLFGKPMALGIGSGSMLLIRPNEAQAFDDAETKAVEAALARTQAAQSVANSTTDIPITVGNVASKTPATPSHSGKTGIPTTAAPGPKRRFFGSIELNQVNAKKQFAELCDEILLQFTAKPGVKVVIQVDISADASPTTDGFDAQTQRTVKENCGVLKFKSAEFDD